MYDVQRPLTILIADDDPDDVLIIREACLRAGVPHEIHAVGNGEELLSYLRREGAYAVPTVSPRPELILLDLNMPRMDGREALTLIKADPDLCGIPIVVLSESTEARDIGHAYDIGANSYMSKPGSLQELGEMVDAMGRFWFEIARLPAVTDGRTRRIA